MAETYTRTRRGKKEIVRKGRRKKRRKSRALRYTLAGIVPGLGIQILGAIAAAKEATELQSRGRYNELTNRYFPGAEGLRFDDLGWTRSKGAKATLALAPFITGAIGYGIYKYKTRKKRRQ